MRLSVFFLTLLALTACNDHPSSLRLADKRANYVMAESANDFGGQEGGNALVKVDRMLIREATLNFQCEDVTKTKSRLDDLVKKYKGYSTNEGQHAYQGDEVMYSLTIRVPAASLDTLVAQIESLATEIEDKNISSEDVTEEFIDVSTRLATKKELEARYREILKSARTVEEILAVEKELNNVRSEIESMEGRVNYLQNRVQLSTVNVTYYQPATKNFGFASKFMSAFGEGWDNLLSFIIALFQAWPFLLLIGAGVWAFFKYLRKPKKA